MRRLYLKTHYPNLKDAARDAAERSDDAFDALVSGLEMDRHRNHLGRLPVRMTEERLIGRGKTRRPGVGP